MRTLELLTVRAGMPVADGVTVVGIRRVYTNARTQEMSVDVVALVEDSAFIPLDPPPFLTNEEEE